MRREMAVATGRASSFSATSLAQRRAEHLNEDNRQIFPFGLRAKARQVDPGLLAAASALSVVLLVSDLIERFC
jgi:hypothetical protein